MSTDWNAFLRKNFPGVKVEDATDDDGDFLVQVDKVAIKKAVVNSCNECVLAKATCQADKHILAAAFYENAQYVVLYDETTDSYRCIRRVPSRAATKMIDHYDTTGDFTAGNYLFFPPKGSQTLVAALARSKKRPGRHKPTNSGVKRKATAGVAYARVRRRNKAGTGPKRQMWVRA